MEQKTPDLNDLQNELISNLVEYINLLIDAETVQNEMKIYDKMLENPQYYKSMISRVKSKNEELKQIVEKKPKKNFC